jgi:methionine transaminase
MPTIQSKLPHVGTTIFSIMSSLAVEHQAINLSQGFPNFECSPRLQRLIYDYMQRGFNQYSPMQGVPILRERIAEKIQTLYSANVHPDDITITAGGTQALFTAITAFVQIGDEVIIIEPAYDSYRPAIELCGGIPVVYELQAPDYQIDWTKMATLISPKTKMIMLNTPHNPTGSVWKKEDMIALQNLVRNTEILVLSDEVYEHLIYDNLRHESVLYYPELWERSMIVYSFGKTFHATGWKMGYVVAPPPLTQEFRKVHQFNVFSVNTPIQYAIAEFLETPEEYLNLPNFYQQKRDFFLEATANTPFKALPCYGTYFQLFEYGHLSNEGDFDFAKRLIKDIGVATIPVSVFYSSKRDDKVIRLCFAKTEETLEKAGRLLEKMKLG